MMNTQCGDFDGCGFPSGGRRVLCRLLLGLVSSLASVQAQETAAPSPASSVGVVAEVPPLVQPDAALSFERQVRPLLKTWCLDCHGGEATEGGLDLRQRRFLMRGGESGPAAVAGDAAGSLLLQRIRSGEMPPGEKKMAAADAAVLEQWIAAGAPTLRDEPAQLPPGLGITEEERSYWAFQPIRRPVVPEFDAALRIRTPIDALLMQQMQPRGLTFSPDADRRTLIRRASLDLLGIPPTPEQVDEFVNDPGEDAWERLVDRLLAMPQYGERWGRHWLDAAGYADSEGATNTDAERPNAWRYRDYVIQSFNSDKPASRFIQEQLAGDELAGSLGPELTAEQTELLTAVGFLTMAANGTGSGDNSAAARNQTITDTIRIVSTSLLGLSVGCAQCHDHRYDPISQVDYYRLRAVFDPALDWQNWKTPAERQVSLYTTADRQKATEVESRAAEVSRERGLKEAEYMRAALEQELTKYAEPLRGQLKLAYETPGDKRTAEQQDLLKAHPAVNISPGVLYQYNQAAADDLKKYDERIAAIRAEKPVEHFLRTLVEPAGHLPASHRFHRGEFGQPKESVTPGELQAASLFTDAPEIPVDDPQLPTTGRRLAYAKWLTSGRHPLLARVLMNRFWLHHFGRAFVSTPGEFGRLGAAPSQPELLDWLAAEFMEGGWTWTRMHRLVLMAPVYRQSGGDRAEMAAIDPNNLLYWRKPLIRLDAEVVRDAVLAVSGGLNSAMGGAPAAVQADDTGQIVEAGVTGRRSVYIQVRRSQPLAMLAAFDAPVMELNCTGRTTTNSAPQALLMMNSQFALSGAEKLADAALRRAAARGGFASAEDPVVRLQLPRMTAWEVGTGRVREAAEAAAAGAPEQGNPWVQFEALTFWTGSSYQAGPSLPDAVRGWVLLNAQGGHPGDVQHAAIRRFHVPAVGRMTFTGSLSRPAANGDGVRARVVSSRRGVLGEWTVLTGGGETVLPAFDVQTAEILDLVVDCVGTVESDSFAWSAVLTLTAEDGTRLGEWKSESALTAPTTDPGVLPAAVTEAWRLALGRGLTSEEREVVSGFVAEQGAWLTSDGKGRAADVVRQVLVDVCQALISGNEFLYSE
ncbi:MAG: PSD1 and planctomycete cytochrome C domain-containing protein [Planctomyces sp.]